MKKPSLPPEENLELCRSVVQKLQFHQKLRPILFLAVSVINYFTMLSSYAYFSRQIEFYTILIIAMCILMFAVTVEKPGSLQKFSVCAVIVCWTFGAYQTFAMLVLVGIAATLLIDGNKYLWLSEQPGFPEFSDLSLAPYFPPEETNPEVETYLDRIYSIKQDTDKQFEEVIADIPQMDDYRFRQKLTEIQENQEMPALTDEASSDLRKTMEPAPVPEMQSPKPPAPPRPTKHYNFSEMAKELEVPEIGGNFPDLPNLDAPEASVFADSAPVSDVPEIAGSFPDLPNLDAPETSAFADSAPVSDVPEIAGNFPDIPTDFPDLPNLDEEPKKDNDPFAFVTDNSPITTDFPEIAGDIPDLPEIPDIPTL